MVHSHGPSAPQKPSGKTEDAALGTCALVTSFKFSSLGKALSLNSHIVRHILVVRTSTWEFWGDTVQPIGGGSSFSKHLRLWIVIPTWGHITECGGNDKHGNSKHFLNPQQLKFQNHMPDESEVSLVSLVHAVSRDFTAASALNALHCSCVTPQSRDRCCLTHLSSHSRLGYAYELHGSSKPVCSQSNVMT